MIKTNINIEVVSVRSELERDLYRFYFSDRPICLILQEYHLRVRKTKRHKFRTREYWSRVDRRNNTLTEVDLPAVICERARQELMSILADVDVQ